MSKDPEIRARIQKQGQRVVETEAQALMRLPALIGDDFIAAASDILERCSQEGSGRLIVSGMGKPGFIAQKISATFASTGIPSFALHPADALHGDLGRVGDKDVVLLLSNSGGTKEMVDLLTPLKRSQARIIVMTSKKESPLAMHADVVLDLGNVIEACPLGLAPTTSSTVMLALGDALAMACLEVRDFNAADFAQYHPGGSLGRQLMTVTEVMRTGTALPLMTPQDTIAQALHVMTATEGRPGAVCVVEDMTQQLLTGFFTDGDLRRLLSDGPDSFQLSDPVSTVMHASPTSVDCSKMASEAARVLAQKHLDQLPVIDDNQRVVGLLDIQDLLTLGFTP
jgi:arabinose-5-phosphate isomerase